MKPIYLKPGQTVEVVPMKEEPVWEEAPMLCDDGIWRGRYRYGTGYDWDVAVDEFEPPFLPNEKCYVPETWCKSIVEGIIYKDGYDVPDAPRWRPAVTMPAKYARRFVTIVSCEPIRVSEISEEDCIAMGFGHQQPYDVEVYEQTDSYPIAQFVADWHKKHPGKEWAWITRTEG